MLIATDPLSLVFIACFLFGLLFFLVTALLGSLGQGHVGTHGMSHQLGMHWGGHTPTTHVVGASHGTSPGTHIVAHGATGSGQQVAHSNTQGNNFSLFSLLNPTSIVLFLLGFGFFGYVFHNTTQLELPLALVFAAAGGIVLAALLLVLLSRIFGESEANTILDVSDRTGLLGKVSITIPQGGLGEVLYISPGGLRKSIPARSVDGQRLETGQEVVVVNYQGGIAEVDTWERFINEEDAHENFAGVYEGQTPQEHEEELAKLRSLLEQAEPVNSELIMRKDAQKE